jgi:hypothetical protein
VSDAAPPPPAPDPTLFEVWRERGLQAVLTAAVTAAAALAAWKAKVDEAIATYGTRLDKIETSIGETPAKVVDLLQRVGALPSPHQGGAS